MQEFGQSRSSGRAKKDLEAVRAEGRLIKFVVL